MSGRQNHSRSIKYEHCGKGANSNSTVVFALEGTLVVISLVTWFVDTLTGVYWDGQHLGFMLLEFY